jgi:DNA polymerase
VIKWDDPNPVWFDTETQSAADLKEVGGRLYAQDASTRVLTAVFLVDGAFHVWIPGHVCSPEAAAHLDAARMWPVQLGPAQPVQLHYGDFPKPVFDAATERRTFCAHNCLGFDRFIWEHCIAPAAPLPKETMRWADTLPIARAAGMPGKLNLLAKDLVGTGKDAGHRILMKHIHAQRDPDGNGCSYTSPGPGELEVICRYNVADVDLLRRAWQVLDTIPVEADVIAAHDAINGRGVCVDVSLAQKLVQASSESVELAGRRIAELTGDVLHNGVLKDGTITKGRKGNLRSVPQVNAWLESKGVRILSNAVDENGQRKRTLRKDFVEQALANPWLMLDENSPVVATADIDPAVFEVLRLRSAALRITGDKGKRAAIRADRDGRARDLFTYHQAHTGRWSSTGIQVHNLPRPRKGVPVDRLLAMHASGEWGIDAKAAYALLAAECKAAGPKVTVDDAIASLLRPLFVPAAGHCFCIADYAAIECRGIAWIAGEEGLLNTLASGGDVYKEMASRIFGVAVADVTDAQRQVGKVTVLGCGYSMSAEKFRIYCGLQGIDLAAAGTSAEACVEAFRALYPAIAGTPAGYIDGKPYRTGGVWSRLARAAMDAVACGGIHEAGRTKWAYDGGTLNCELPSGRVLRYRHARIEDRVPGYARALGIDRPKATLIYETDRGEQFLYGGKIAENVVQALCRDLLATAIVNCEATGLPVVTHVHDEIVAEVPLWVRDSSLNLLATVMTTPPAWAAGFPVAVEAYAAPRYLKGPPEGWPHVKLCSA